MQGRDGERLKIEWQRTLRKLAIFSIARRKSGRLKNSLGILKEDNSSGNFDQLEENK